MPNCPVQARLHIVLGRRWRSAQAATHQEALVNVPETKVSKLPNGLRIATEDSGIPTATVSIAIPVSNHVNFKILIFGGRLD